MFNALRESHRVYRSLPNDTAPVAPLRAKLKFKGLLALVVLPLCLGQSCASPDLSAQPDQVAADHPEAPPDTTNQDTSTDPQDPTAGSDEDITADEDRAATPTARAGADQQVTEGATVSLNGSASTGNGELGYSWKQLSGTSVVLNSPKVAICTFTAPQITVDPELLKFELTVTNVWSSRKSLPVIRIAKDVKWVTVHKAAVPVNQAPIADSTAVTSVTNQPATITLTGSDPDGQPLAFTLFTPPAHGTLGTVNPVSSTQAVVTYTPDSGYSGTDAFQFQVNDGSAASPAATVTVNMDAPGSLSLSPATGLTSSGSQGGPFSPASVTYTLSNSGSTAIDWTAAKVVSFVSLSKSSGTLASGATDTVIVSITSLANLITTGSYSDTVSFTNTTNGTGDTTRGVSLTISGAGSLALSSANGLSSSGSQGGPFSPASTSYTISNPGTASINWTAAKTKSWVSLSKASGTLAAGGSDTVAVSINSGANSLVAASYSDTITFTNTTNGTGNTTRGVALTVNAPGTLVVASASGLTSSGNQGGPFSPTSVTYNLSNSGSTSINWTAARTQSWVTLSKASGTLAAGGTDSVAVSINSNANSLAAGSFNDTVTFTNTTNNSGNTTRSVSLTVNTVGVPSPGVLAVSSSSGLTSSGNQGGPFSPTSTTYTLSNTGGTSIGWTAAKTQTWVSLSKTSGTLAAGASDTVAVSINSGANSQTSGTKTDTVTLTNSTNGTGNTTRSVSLVVQPLLTIQATPNSGTAPLPVQFTALSGGVAATLGLLPVGSTLNWNFGDGTPVGSGLQVNHTYNSAGTFVAALTLTLPLGLGTISCDQRTVQVAGLALPGPITASYAATAVTLDGSMGASEWTDAQAYTMDGVDTAAPGIRVLGSTATTADSSATIYVKHDASYLYIAVKVTDNALITTSSDVNQSWLADLVEIYLDSDNSDSQLGFPGDANGFHIATTAGGAQNGSLTGTGAWDSAAATGSGQWVAEFRISKSATNMVNGGVYGFDVAVHDYDVAAQSTPETLYQYFASSQIWGSNGLMDESLLGDIILQVPTNPVLTLNQTVLDFGTSSNSLPMTVTNTGVSTLSYTISSNAAWLTVNPASGSSTGEQDAITVSVNRSSLAAGTYNGTLTINGGTGGSTNVSASVQVAPGTLSVTSSGGLSTSGLVGGPFSPSSATYTVSNTGNSSINWTAAKTQSWVTLSKTSGTLAVGATDSVVVSIGSGANSLAAGSYSDTVTLTNTTNGSGNTTRSVTLSANSTSAQAMTVASRTSGVAPLAVFFDAIGAGSGVAQPSGSPADYGSFYYKWDFADPSSGTWATDGKSKNAAIGYVASHVFETPGTYRVTLQVTNASDTTFNYFQDITVQAFGGTTYYVAGSGSDSNSGTNQSAPLKTWSKAMSVAGSNVQILFKRGETFSGTNVGLGNGPINIGAYGTGAAPVISNGAISDVGNDVRIMDLNFSGSSGSNGLVPGINTLCLRTRLSGYEYGAICDSMNGGGPDRDNDFFVDSQFVNTGSYGMFFSTGKHLSLLGCTFDGTGQHLARLYIRSSIIGHNIFRNGGFTQIKLNALAVSRVGHISEFIILSDNQFLEHTQYFSRLAIGPQNTTSPGEISENIIVERNLFKEFNPAGRTVGLDATVDYMTIRNNTFINVANAILDNYRVSGGSSNQEWKILNNTQYQNSQYGGAMLVSGSYGNGLTIKNNILSQPSGSSTDYSMDISVPSLSQIIDGNNTWYVPAIGQMFSVNGQTYSYAQWQSAGKGAGNKNTNPMLTNGDAGDVHLQTGSPAIDAGTALTAHVQEDAGGSVRPLGSGYDMGVYER